MLKKLLVATLFILVSLTGVCCWQTKSHKEEAIDEVPAESPVFAFWLIQDDPQYLGVSEGEALEIEKVIETFERFKYQKDFVSAIKMLTPPQTNDEKGWFDHLLGNDAVRVSGRPFPRFLNKVNFHLLAGYDIEKTTKDGNVVYAHIKELRVIDVANEGARPEPVTDIQDLTFELVKNNGGYQISKYYHTNPASLVDLKYEGFVAN